MPLFRRRMAGSSQKQIVKAVETFINAQTSEECKRIIEAQSDKLLTDDADELRQCIQNAKDDYEACIEECDN